MTMTEHSFILTLSCADRPGIVHAVSGFLFERGANILDSAQFGDRYTGEFFMRVHFQQIGGDPGEDKLRGDFGALADTFGMRWQLHDANVKPRVLIMVSKIGHCLNDLLFRHRTDQLPIEIAAIVSNHKDFYQLAASYNIPFHHFPLAAGAGDAAKAAQEAKIIEIIDAENIDLVVLARYMQILSPALCRKLEGRAINIHHSFLPSFKGAKPYYQAFDRGVKLIGATAHYVTGDLDEGPIIEQEVERVDHGMDPDQLTAIGRDVECVTLARAVKWHVEHRIVLNGHKTVVFK
ncbi:Formyltetrahydrofolate deformylase [Pararobbsia alpina]|jgi:formyltetrahydrofolate deformylase|uniref:formyltetrahydrofolate deformylase n=1 Tax=Pararobbsia alpina TaxID=621374 RepID=UPI0039A4EA72